ncbi:hypothetical protein FRC09_006129, partial [Ceratobasidium sp. 395]
MAIVGDTASFKHLHCIPLDESAYSLAPDELEFYQSTTNIDNEVELKRHILDIQAKAYKLACTQHCVVGNDARKAALDGYPVKNIVATDLRRGEYNYFWDLGFKLFKDDPVTFPVPFLQGDIFDTKFLDPDATKSSNRPDFSGLNSLTDLLGHTAIIHASAFFHLFSE